MQYKFVRAYAETAQIFANLSSARRLKVGAIIVKDDRIISIGYNGTVAGWDNNCEDVVYWDGVEPRDESRYMYQDDDGNWFGYKTKQEVIHAEMNSLCKLARSTESGLDAYMFVTHSPCIECAKAIAQSGIKFVYYLTEYRSSDGIEFLRQCGVEVKRVDLKDQF